nr:uncharacterized protein LOC129269746 [Lytechinus pictus]
MADVLVTTVEPRRQISSLISILHIADSGFPTGAFSHSVGFEAAMKQGHIYDQQSFKNFIVGAMENAGSFSLPFVRAGYEMSENMTAIISLDRYCDACITNHVASRASSQQGRSLILTSSETFPDQRIKNLMNSISEPGMKGHQALMFGCLCAYLDIPVRDCLEVFIFNILKILCVSVVKLGHIGPLQAQRIQYEHQKNIANIVDRNLDRGVEESCISFPLADIFQNTHDTLFSRLFCS